MTVVVIVQAYDACILPGTVLFPEGKNPFDGIIRKIIIGIYADGKRRPKMLDRCIIGSVEAAVFLIYIPDLKILLPADPFPDRFACLMTRRPRSAIQSPLKSAFSRLHRPVPADLFCYMKV